MTSHRWGVQTGKRRGSKLATIPSNPCKCGGGPGTLETRIVVWERQGEMPGPKRNRRERTEEWASIKQWTLWPEQELYEQIRPLILFHETAGERAKEIDVPQRTLARKADEFERYGMQSLFSSGEQGGERATSKTLPAEIRQLIVDLHAELPTMSWLTPFIAMARQRPL